MSQIPKAEPITTYFVKQESSSFNLQNSTPQSSYDNNAFNGRYGNSIYDTGSIPTYMNDKIDREPKSNIKRSRSQNVIYEMNKFPNNQSCDTNFYREDYYLGCGLEDEKEKKLERNRQLSRLRRLKNRNTVEYLEFEINNIQLWLERLEGANMDNLTQFDCLLSNTNTILNCEERNEELLFQYNLLSDQFNDLLLYLFEGKILKWLMKCSYDPDEDRLKQSLKNQLHLTDQQINSINNFQLSSNPHKFKEYISIMNNLFNGKIELLSYYNAVHDTIKDSLSLKQMTEYSKFLEDNRNIISDIDINKTLDQNNLIFPL